jgi:hypothetical protein
MSRLMSSPTPHLFHVPSRELPCVLLELKASLKPRCPLQLESAWHNEEGWSQGRYGVYHDLDAGAAICQSLGSLS